MKKVRITAFDVKARKNTVIKNPEIVKLKSGRWAVKGKSALTGIEVYKIISADKAKELRKKLEKR